MTYYLQLIRLLNRNSIYILHLFIFALLLFDLSLDLNLIYQISQIPSRLSETTIADYISSKYFTILLLSFISYTLVHYSFVLAKYYAASFVSRVSFSTILSWLYTAPPASVEKIDTSELLLSLTIDFKPLALLFTAIAESTRSIVASICFLSALLIISYPYSLYSPIPLALLIVIFFSLKRKISKTASSSRKLEDQLYRHLFPVISHIRHLSRFSATESILSPIMASQEAYLRTVLRGNFLASAPRLFLETLSLAAASTVVVINFSNPLTDQSFSQILFAAFLTLKLLPYINQSIYSLSQVSVFSKSACKLLSLVDRLHKTRTQHPVLLSENHDAFFSDKRSLYLSYKSNEIILHPGQILLISGPSGSGKTTLLNSFYLNPNNSSLRLIDRQISPSPTSTSWTDSFLYLQSSPAILSGSLMYNATLSNHLSESQHSFLQTIFDDLLLTNAFTDSSLTLNSYINADNPQLSNGQQQRLILARALFHPRKYIIMDEALSGLDFETEIACLRAINRHLPDSYVFMISHSQGLSSYVTHNLIL